MSRQPPGQGTAAARRHLLTAVSALLAMSALTMSAVAGDADADVLATVAGAPITRAELTAFLAKNGGDHQPADGQQRAAIDAAALERLVDETLLRGAISAAGISVDPARVTAAVEQLRGQLQSTRGISLEKMLEQSGGDEESLRRKIEFEMAAVALVAPRVDDTAIAAAFEKHRRDLDGTRVRVSHVILRPDLAGGEEAMAACLRRAADIRADIMREDLSFAAAAARHSAGPSRHRGGDLGFLARRAGGIHEAFAREAFALDVGELSQPFATPSGVHLVTVTAVEPGTATLEQLRPQLQQLAVQEAVRVLVGSLRKTTPITYSPGTSHPDAGNSVGER